MVAEQHPGAVDLEAGQRLGRRAGGQYDVLARVRRVADLHGGGRDQPALAGDELDAAALHQTLQALVEPGDDAFLILADGRRVDALERRLHAELLALPGEVGDLAGMQQCLGGDAAAVQACAAQLRLVDQHDAHAELCRTKRARVSTAAAAQDDEVDVGLSHRGSPQLFSPDRRRSPSDLCLNPSWHSRSPRCEPVNRRRRCPPASQGWRATGPRLHPSACIPTAVRCCTPGRPRRCVPTRRPRQRTRAGRPRR